MTIQVTGILVTPTGNPIANAVIRISSLETNLALAYASAKETTGLDGSYDFNLVNGKHKIEILQTNTYKKVAYVEVTLATTSPITLEELINSYAFCEVEAPTCPV